VGAYFFGLTFVAEKWARNLWPFFGLFFESLLRNLISLANKEAPNNLPRICVMLFLSHGSTVTKSCIQNNSS
jgi:hypothetical protein